MILAVNYNILPIINYITGLTGDTVFFNTVFLILYTTVMFSVDSKQYYDKL